MAPCGGRRRRAAASAHHRSCFASAGPVSPGCQGYHGGGLIHRCKGGSGMRGCDEALELEPTTDLVVTVTDGAPPVVALAGEVDLATAPRFERAINALFNQGSSS